MLNNGSDLGGFVRFRPHTCACTQQSLPPIMGSNNGKLEN